MIFIRYDFIRNSIMRTKKYRKTRKTRKNRKQRKTRKARGGRKDTDIGIPNFPSQDSLSLYRKTKDVNTPGMTKNSEPNVDANVVYTIPRLPILEKVDNDSPDIPNANHSNLFTQELNRQIQDALKTPNNNQQELLNNLKSQTTQLQKEIETKIQNFKDIPENDTQLPDKTPMEPSQKSNERDMLLVDIPNIPNQSSRPKGGNNPEPLTIENLKDSFNVHTDSIDDLVLAIKSRIHPINIRFHIDSVNNGKIQYNTSNSQQSLKFIANGTFNALYEPDFFTAFNNTDHILRISRTPIDDVKESIYEICYGILAADKNIGPKIYRYGTMPDMTNSSSFYFYSIIERIDGSDIHKLILNQLPKMNTNIFATNTNNTFETVIDSAIDKLRRAGTECGFLMMDSKPANVMVSKDETNVYVVDYDQHFIYKFNPKTSPSQELYGKINVILFLANTYVGILKYINSSHLDENLGKPVGTYIFNQLKSEYYHNTDFENIQTFIQQLYFKYGNLLSVCHHYSLVQQGLLKIRYLTKYSLSYHQMSQYADKDIIFFTDRGKVKHSYDYPIYIESKNNDITVYDLKHLSSGIIVDKNLKPYNEFCNVFSFNRLCINNRDAYTPFECIDNYTTERQNNKRLINKRVECINKYIVHIDTILIPEFKMALYTTENDMSTTIKLFISSIIKKHTDNTSTMKEIEEYNGDDTYIQLHIEHVKVQSLDYKKKLIDAFKNNFDNIDTKEYIISINRSSEDIDKQTLEILFPSNQDICSNQNRVIVELYDIIKGRPPNPKPETSGRHK